MTRYIQFIFIGLMLLTACKETENELHFNQELYDYVSSLENEFSFISDIRKKNLEELSDSLIDAWKKENNFRLLFLCKQNGVQSMLCQQWAHTASVFYEVDKVKTYSGGIEETAVSEALAKTLERCGFTVFSNEKGFKNPTYEVQEGDKYKETKLFSKKYDDQINPNKNVAVILCDSEFEENIPTVEGAAFRVSLPFESPAKWEKTMLESQHFDISCRQVAREMFYLFKLIKEKTTK